jgi:mono/diheme cytochrome c family protein
MRRRKAQGGRTALPEEPSRYRLERDENSLKPLLAFVFACVVAGTLATGCSKSSDASSSSTGSASTGAGAATSGPVTDADSTGMKSASTVGDPMHGKAIFAQNCSSCHGAGGVGGGIGPTLKNEKSRKDDAKTIAWIKNPQPPMPKLWPSPLNDKDVADVAAYVQSL